MFHGKVTQPHSEVSRPDPVPYPVRNTSYAGNPGWSRTSIGAASHKIRADLQPRPGLENSQKFIPSGDLPFRFLTALEAAEDSDTLKEILLCGYGNVQSLSNHLRSFGIAADARLFLKQCSYRTYYRLFSPLVPHHPKPYHDPSLTPRDIDTSMKIQVELFALENSVGDNIKAGLKITAEWSPALWELRSWKARDAHPAISQSQRQIDDVLKNCVEYVRLPTTGDMLKRAILDYSFAGHTAFFGPILSFSTSRSGETKLLNGYTFSHIHAAARPKRLGAAVNVTEHLLTDGDFQHFPFDTRVAAFHITSNASIREIKFAPPSLLEISQLCEQARLLSRGNDWLVYDVEVELSLQDINGQDRDDPRQMKPRFGSFKPEQDTDRSRMTVKFTLKRNWRSWFWKIVFPMDIVTIVGFNAFLLIPAKPTADQHIAISTYLGVVLFVQAAFAISAQPMLPKVSSMTLLDFHNNFCFLLTAVQTVIFITLPNSLWGKLANSDRRYLAFGLVLLVLVLEHLYMFLICPRFRGKQVTEEPPIVQDEAEPFDPEKVPYMARNF